MSLPGTDSLSIEDSIRRFVVRNFLFGRDDEKLDLHASFISMGILDSTGVLELVEFAEHTFGIEVGDDELVPENFDSVKRLAAFVGRKLDASPPLPRE